MYFFYNFDLKGYHILSEYLCKIIEKTPQKWLDKFLVIHSNYFTRSLLASNFFKDFIIALDDV